MRVDADVFDVGRRIREGDPTSGWSGDTAMSLRVALPVDPTTGEPVRSAPPRFEVWGVDARGMDYMVLSWPRCDASLLAELRRLTSTPLEVRVALRQRQLDRDRARAAEAARAPLVDRLAWGLKRDLGHQYGGTSRFVHALSGLRRQGAHR